MEANFREEGYYYLNNFDDLPHAYGKISTSWVVVVVIVVVVIVIVVDVV